MIDPDAIIAAATECKETPFHHQGRVPGVGIDCAGLLVHILKKHGLPYIDERAYPRSPYHGLMQRILDSQPSLLRIKRTEYQRGDILLMRFSAGPQHVAVYAGTSIIHASADHGKCVEHRLDAQTRLRVTAAYRIVNGQ